MRRLSIFYTIVAILVFLVSDANAVNFTQCLFDLQTNTSLNSQWPDDGRDNRGQQVIWKNATAMTYRSCVGACGGGQEPFEWSVFSQQFSAWLLPWLALVSQLPFGANDKLDNLESVLLTVGSPTLAAYSLTLTVLNGRWIARRFANHRYPNTQSAVRILSSLQQSPLCVTLEDGLLASLVVLPQNDEWWRELVIWLDYTHTWSISAVTSIAWVVIAYVFTVVDSFTGDISAAINANGQGVGSLWLWLLPIVIGWLQISPKCDSPRLFKAMKRANSIAYVATDNGPPVLASSVSEEHAIALESTHVNEARRDEECTSPIFNYARFLPWVQAVEDVSGAFAAASYRYHRHKSVNPSIDWIPEEKSHAPHRDNRIGSTRQVIKYCQPEITHWSRSRWGPDVISRMFTASLLALMLQWGTIGAAVIVVWFTPTQGLGCRSASYLLYGALSTIAWALLLISSILTHYSSVSPREYKGYSVSSLTTRAARHLSISLRRLGKFVAALNATWIVVSCLFQFSSVFDRCYCNSSVFGLKNFAYNVIALVPRDLIGMRAAWIGGVGLAGGSAIIFSGFVNLFINPPLPEY